MPNRQFDHVQILSSEQYVVMCECGQQVQSLDGDCVNVELGEPVRGIGWLLFDWDCPDCGKVYSLSLGVVSEPQDDAIAIDNFQEAEETRTVLLEKDGLKVFGVEQFNVKHENPIADFAMRHYTCMAEYTLGPMRDRKKLLELARLIAHPLIDRVQLGMTGKHREILE